MWHSLYFSINVSIGINCFTGVGSWRAGTPCGERRSGEKSVAHLLKPCCVDLKGTCELVSHAHCIFIGGVFHRTGPEHCSQVEFVFVILLGVNMEILILEKSPW